MAIASADAGQDPAGLGYLGVLVHFVLLQPIAHWLLAAIPLAWWTWSGLAVLALLLFANSVLGVSILFGAYRVLSGPRHSGP